MSHVIGDGHTYYNLLDMLDFRKEPKALIATRILSFEKSLKEFAPAATASAEWFFGFPSMFSMVYNIVFKNYGNLHCRDFSMESISKLKKDYADRLISKTAVSFVSSNDILTAWAFNLSNADIGFMAINLRNRIPEITDSHAGNYESSIAFLKSDFIASDIRGSLQNLNKVPLLPGFLSTLFRIKSALVTSWASFYRPLFLLDCSIKYHVPVQTESISFPLDVFCIFKPTSEKLAVGIMSRSIDEKTLECDMINAINEDTSYTFSIKS